MDRARFASAATVAGASPLGCHQHLGGRVLLSAGSAANSDRSSSTRKRIVILCKIKCMLQAWSCACTVASRLVPLLAWKTFTVSYPTDAAAANIMRSMALSSLRLHGLQRASAARPAARLRARPSTCGRPQRIVAAAAASFGESAGGVHCILY